MSNSRDEYKKCKATIGFFIVQTKTSNTLEILKLDDGSIMSMFRCCNEIIVYIEVRYWDFICKFQEISQQLQNMTVN